MKLYIDSANIKDIERIVDKFPVSGVTTNPTLISREKNNPIDQLKKIKEVLDNDMELHVQVISEECEEMIKEANHIRNVLGENTFIKVPVTDEGIKAMMLLSKEGVNITATAIYTPMQALMAAKAGARWTAPYVNRLDMIGADGVDVAVTINEILFKSDTKGQLLGASFKNVGQILDMAKQGVPAVTVSPEMLEQMLYHPLTDKAVSDFISDFEEVAGQGKTMLD